MSNNGLYQEPKNGDFVAYINKMQQGQILNLKRQAYFDKNAQASAITKANVRDLKADAHKSFHNRSINEHNKKVSQKHSNNVKKSFSALSSNDKNVSIKPNTTHNIHKANVDVFASPFNQVNTSQKNIAVAGKVLPMFAVLSLVLAIFVDPFFAVFFVIIMVAYSNMKARAKRENTNKNI